MHQRLIEIEEFIPGHRTVDIITVSLVVAGFIVGFGKIDAVAGHDRSDGIVEIQGIFAGQTAEFLSQCAFAQRSGTEDRRLIQIDRGDFLMDQFDARVREDDVRDLLGETFPVDCQGGACRDAVLVRAHHDQRMQFAAFLFQQSDRVFLTVAAQGIGTDQFGKVVGLEGRMTLYRFLLKKGYFEPFFC